MNGKSALLMCIEKGCKTGDHKCSQGSIIDDVVRQVKGESVGWSESQKEAIRETVLEPTSRLTKELVEHYQKQGYGLWESVDMANGEQLHSILCELEKVVGLDEK